MERYKQLQVIIEKLNLRERAIVLAAILLVLFGVWFTLWFSTSSAQRANIDENTEKLLTDKKRLKQQIQLLIEATSGDVFRDQKLQLENLHKRQADMDEELARLSQGLVSAAKLSQLLQDVLKNTQTIKLKAMRTLPVASQSFALNTAEESVSTEAIINPVKTAGVYQHGVVMTVQGRYTEVVTLLTSLEALPWRFYWDYLYLNVNEYPEAEVEINVYTLSAEEGFLGV